MENKQDEDEGNECMILKKKMEGKKKSASCSSYSSFAVSSSHNDFKPVNS